MDFNSRWASRLLSREPTSVLLVDDDVELCQVMTEFLGRHGFRVSTVHDAFSRTFAHRADRERRRDSSHYRLRALVRTSSNADDISAGASRGTKWPTPGMTRRATSSTKTARSAAEASVVGRTTPSSAP